MPEIIINLNESADAKGFKIKDEVNNGDLIHHNEFLKVTDWIAKRVAKLPPIGQPQNKNISRERLHDTITILGTRGSGKTSFMLSLLESYKEHHQISVLNIIDPTLIEEKGHVFLSIIACIKAVVEKALDRKETNPGNDLVISRKQWRDKLKELAHGLPAIDGVGKDLQQDAWQDAEFIMDKGIRHVTSASHLEENFQHFMEAGLQILGKDCFIIPFDDIDIDFRKGWMVLETIRKYLTSPRIIVLLSGDMKLFSLGIRKHKWENFGTSLLKNEGERFDRMPSFKGMVTDMENQYLQKVLKPELQIRLNTLYEKLILTRGDTTVKVQIEKGNRNILDFYNQVLARFGIRNSVQRDTYRSYLLRLPLRSQLKFLSAFLGEQTDIDVIINTFISYLYDQEINVDLALSSPHFIDQIIFDLLLRKKYLAEGYQLQPTSAVDSSLNGALMAMTLLYSRYTTNHPFLIFDYWVKVGYTYCLFDTGIFSYVEKEKDSNRDSVKPPIPTINGLGKYSGIDQYWDLTRIADRMAGYMRGTLNLSGNRQRPGLGLIPLNTLQQTRAGLYPGRIDAVFSASDPDRTIAYLPLASYKNTANRSGVLIYSVLRVLAVTGQLLQETNEFGRSDEKEIRRQIVSSILGMAQLSAYTLPVFDGLPDESVTSDSEDNQSDVSRSIDPDLVHAISKWINNYPKAPISPHLLGKSIRRFFASLSSIEAKSVNLSLGALINTQVIAFLNAVIIEEARENDISGSINFSNVVSDDRYFKENIQSVVKSERARLMHLSRWLCSNPLFAIYMDIGRSESDLFITLSSFVDISKLSQLSIFDKLAEVKQHTDNRRDTAQNNIENNNDENQAQRKRYRRDYEALIQSLKDNKVPFVLFDPANTDWLTTRNNNEEIRTKYAHLFRDVSSAALRGFRHYLAEDPTRSW